MFKPGSNGAAGTFPFTNRSALPSPLVNTMVNELAAIVQAAGGTLDPSNDGQVAAAILEMIEARVGDYVAATGVANAYVAALDPVITAYTAKTAFNVKIPVANTGAATLNAGGGAVPLVRDDGVALGNGDLPAGSVISVVYDVATSSLRITSLVPSQMAALITAHNTDPTSHSQYLKRSVINTYLANMCPVMGSNSLGGNNTTLTVGFSFTAPCAGSLFVISSVNYSMSQGTGNLSILYVDNNVVDTDNTATTRVNFSVVPVNAGAHAVNLIAACTTAFTAHIASIFIPDGRATF